MSRDYYTLEELTRQLGRERRLVEKQVSRGNIPGRRVAGEWRFNKSEITQWLERAIPEFDESDLATLERSQHSTDVCEQSPVASLLQPDLVQVPMRGGTKPSIMKELVTVANRTWQIFDTSAILQSIRQREEASSTAFDGGVAIPHTVHRMPETVGEPLIAFGRSVSGIPFGGPRRQLTDLFFLVLALDPNTHLKVLARLGRLFQTPGFLESLRAAEDSETAYDIIVTADGGLEK